MPDIYERAQRWMGMDDATWDRHANPWSVDTRFAILPGLAAAIWARTWIGWGCLLPVCALLVFAWVNPRLFPPPARRDGWAAHGTFGERVFLNRHAVPIPAHHRRWGNGLTAAAMLGVVPLGWGLWALDPGWTLLGLTLAMGAKTWFVDRMVWLYRDMAAQRPDYAAWATPGRD